MPIIRSSRVIQMVAACGTWRFGSQVVGLVWSCGLCVRFEQHPANRTHNPQFHTRPTTCKPKRQVPQAATICITLELLMMGIMVTETCWANNRFCNKNNLLHLVGLLFPRMSLQVQPEQHGRPDTSSVPLPLQKPHEEDDTQISCSFPCSQKPNTTLTAATRIQPISFTSQTQQRNVMVRTNRKS